MPVYPLGEWIPKISPEAFVAPSADVMGQVEIGPRASIWYNVVLRGDLEPIVIGEATNVQDGSVFHTDRGKPTILGRGVTVGHKACVHGATVEDFALIGIGATILNGARVGSGSIVAAGSLVPEGKVVPPGVLVMGAPFKIKRELSPEEIEGLKARAERYVEWARMHIEWLKGGG